MGWKEQVLARLAPTRDEEKDVAARIAAFLVRLNAAVGDARAVLGGSGAKGTWLRGQHDADIFILFPAEQYRGRSHQLADLLAARLKKAVTSPERLHGSRDYFRVRRAGFTFELIPILDVRKASQAANITDVSPLHAQWVKKNSTRQLRDEIRLAKAFCKAQRCYGAESYIRGFSGYVLEVLTIRYGGFEKLLRAATAWEEKQIVDAAHHYPNKTKVWETLNEAKLHSPLIVIDPVDPARNAAAALGREQWLRFRKQAAAFLKKQGVRFFEQQAASLEALRKKKKRSHLVWLELTPLHAKEDVAGAKLVQAFEFLKRRLHDFQLAGAGWEWDRARAAVFWLIVRKRQRARFELRKGPPVKLEQHAADFRKKHRTTLVRNGILWAKVPVKEYHLSNALRNILKEPRFREQVSRIKKAVVD